MLDERGIDRVAVVGNSMGARVALAMAVKNPQRIRGLVLLSTRVVASATTPAQKLLRDYTPSLAGMEQLIRACFAGDQDLVTPEVIRSRYEASAQPGAHEAMQRVFAGLAATPALDTAELTAIAAPVLLLHGREDRVVPADNGVRLAELLPHADLHLLAGTGHWLQTERADTVNLLITDFLPVPGMTPQYDHRDPAADPGRHPRRGAGVRGTGGAPRRAHEHLDTGRLAARGRGRPRRRGPRARTPRHGRDPPARDPARGRGAPHHLPGPADRRPPGRRRHHRGDDRPRRSELAIGPRPDLRRTHLPLGPVLVYAAGNFPFAFSVAGGDTVSALAAGCPVVVKAHPGHPQLSRRTAAVVSAALDAAGAPPGCSR